MPIYQHKPVVVYAEQVTGPESVAALEALIDSMDPARLDAAGVSNFQIHPYDPNVEQIRITWTQATENDTGTWEGWTQIPIECYFYWVSDWSWRFLPVTTRNGHFMLGLEPYVPPVDPGDPSTPEEPGTGSGGLGLSVNLGL